MFGFELPDNFDSPYRAVRREFWRRWHITLSRFLHDYLYIPLGGNRCGPAPAYDVVATMLLGGLWHGASWALSRGAGCRARRSRSTESVPGIGRGLRLPRPAAWALTLLFAMAGWVLFRSPDFGSAGDVLFSSLAGMHGLGGMKLDREYVAVLIGGAAVALLGPTSQEAAFSRPCGQTRASPSRRACSHWPTFYC